MTRNNSGFTLVELAVTTLLAGILLTLATLKISKAQGGSANSSANELLRILEHSAVSAVRERGEVRVDFVPGFSKYLINGRERSLIGKSIISSARFATLNNHSFSLILRADGSASPGKVVVQGQAGEECTIFQALRGARRIECNYKR